MPEPPAEAVAEAVAEQTDPGQPVIATVEPPAAAAPVVQAQKSNAGRVLVIIGIVFLALVLCTIGSCVGGLALFRSVGSEISSSDFEGLLEEEFSFDDVFFRANPERTGVYPDGGPTSLSEVGRFDTGKEVFSSPAVSGGTVYVGSTDGNVYSLK
ncbi:MAG: PQQ-binding-like beta-propeller repeat protein [Actinomycetota bacterium]|nr:PQQ-binding-like beta-propeller repeat protein [Actinomycetota bacterium]